MDRQPNFLTIPSYPSLLQHGTSYKSPLSPLTPPPRLHLRSLLPSPPISPYLIKEPPPIPYPWIWRCHICHSVYRLGVTRRCLEDGHYFCSLPTPPPSPVSPYSPTTKKKKRRKAPRGCRAEFDYTGWESYNVWRRDTSLQKAQHHSYHNPHYVPPLKTGKDCYRDCDFPSECQTYVQSQSRSDSITPGGSAKSRRKSEPELIFPWSPTSPVGGATPEEIQQLQDEAEDRQILLDLAATTSPCSIAPSSSTNLKVGSGTEITITDEELGILRRKSRERRKSLEIEKRGLEKEALFIMSPSMSKLNTYVEVFEEEEKEREKEEKEKEEKKKKDKGKEKDTYEVEDVIDGEIEDTEEDEKGYVREFIRVKKRKSIAKIEQLTGLKLSVEQYGKMMGEEVVSEGELGAGGSGEGDSSIAHSRRGSMEVEDSPSSPLKMFYTMEDSDSDEEDDDDDEEEEDEMMWDDGKYAVKGF